MQKRDLIIITAPTSCTAAEGLWISTLLRLGVGRIHIRKPQATEEEVEQLILSIPRHLRCRCILSTHVALVQKYQLGGLHLSTKCWEQITARPQLSAWQSVSVSTHSAEDFARLPFVPDYAYLSPVAESISKPGYGGATWTGDQLRQLCAEAPCPLVALGGVNPQNASSLLRMGFQAVASLGHWQGLQLHQLEGALQQFCQPRVLLCGGIDPTSQAGITADVQHASHLGATCTTITTAVTFQNAAHFAGLTPMSDDEIRQQLVALSTSAASNVVKIGFLTSLRQLEIIVHHVRQHHPESLIIWDPILSTSTDHRLLTDVTPEALHTAAAMVDVVTPNPRECAQILGNLSPAEAAKEWQTTVILKSAKQEEGNIIDQAFTPEGQIIESTAPAGGEDRHGTGCLYATTFAVVLAETAALPLAMRTAQRAVMHYRHALPQPSIARKAPLGRRMFLTHGTSTAMVLQQVEAVLSRGLADVVQLRMKDADFELFLATAREVQTVCRNYGVPLLINDRVEVARLIGADGVHLGKEDMSPTEARAILGEGALIGRTCNTAEDLAAALRMPIDYVGVGPYRFTQTKQKLAPVLGLEGYRQLQLCDYPLPAYAIGGIRPDETPLFDQLGIYGTAMSGALLQLVQASTSLPPSTSHP